MIVPKKKLLSTVTVVVAILACLLGQPGVAQRIHPLQTECTSYGCFVDWYCNGETDICEECPNQGVEVTPEDCLVLGSEDSLQVQNCLVDCVRQQTGQTCASESYCEERSSYCDFSSEDDQSGVCQPCKTDVAECAQDGLLGFALEECILCDLRACAPLDFAETQVDGLVISSLPMRGSPSKVASGTVAKCENLIYEEETTCEDESVAGKLCLVDDSTKNTYYISVVRKCTALGGIGALFYGDYSPRTPTNETWRGSLSFQESAIPSVSISFEEGKRLESLPNAIVTINVTDNGNACFRQQFCSDDRPCAGSNEGRYCDFKWGNGEGDGSCRQCPQDAEGEPFPLGCFFVYEDVGRVTGTKAVEDCARTCASSLKFPSCKFCPTDISGFDFSVEDEANRCEFCPDNDVLFPNKNFTLFGEGVKCWQVQQFFESVDVSKDSKNCQLARMMNYVCGCKGPGYAGADTTAKQRALVWLPRVMAMVSFFSSAFIIYDTCKNEQGRRQLMNQLLSMLSLFDIFGALGYVFTTLPIPKDYEFGPIMGANGSEASCKAQGFFIQLGTISAYTNVSLAVYYLLVIVYGWSEERVGKMRWVLFLAPVSVGLAFAFAGLQYYEPLHLWCNNSANWWPDIPVAAAIGVATVLMSMICWHVWRKEAKTQQYHSRASMSRRDSLSSRVFWQSFWYLMAFYLTWPLYLALQYAWSGGVAFTRYGFILTAGTMVPLQGFWNMLVYIRPRYLKGIAKSLSTIFGSTFLWSSSKEPESSSMPGASNGLSSIICGDIHEAAKTSSQSNSKEESSGKEESHTSAIFSNQSS